MNNQDLSPPIQSTKKSHTNQNLIWSDRAVLTGGARGAALCSELAQNVQKVTLVGSFNFGSSWHPFGGFT